MRDEHKGDAAVGGHGGEEFLERVQSAGRGADADHREARRASFAFQNLCMTRRRRQFLGRLPSLGRWSRFWTSRAPFSRHRRILRCFFAAIPVLIVLPSSDARLK